MLFLKSVVKISYTNVSGSGLVCRKATNHGPPASKWFFKYQVWSARSADAFLVNSKWRGRLRRELIDNCYKKFHKKATSHNRALFEPLPSPTLIKLGILTRVTKQAEFRRTRKELVENDHKNAHKNATRNHRALSEPPELSLLSKLTVLMVLTVLTVHTTKLTSSRSPTRATNQNMLALINLNSNTMLNSTCYPTMMPKSSSPLPMKTLRLTMLPSIMLNITMQKTQTSPLPTCRVSCTNGYSIKNRLKLTSTQLLPPCSPTPTGLKSHLGPRIANPTCVMLLNKLQTNKYWSQLINRYDNTRIFIRKGAMKSCLIVERHLRKIIEGRLMQANDVETNPGPRTGPRTDQPETKLMLLTQNCRGLSEEKKLKHLLNNSHKIARSSASFIIALQETMITNDKKLTFGWRGNHVFTPQAQGMVGDA